MGWRDAPYAHLFHLLIPVMRRCQIAAFPIIGGLGLGLQAGLSYGSGVIVLGWPPPTCSCCADG